MFGYHAKFTVPLHIFFYQVYVCFDSFWFAILCYSFTYFVGVACDATVFVVLPSLLVSKLRFGVLMSLGHVWEAVTLGLICHFGMYLSHVFFCYYLASVELAFLTQNLAQYLSRVCISATHLKLTNTIDICIFVSPFTHITLSTIRPTTTSKHAIFLI